MDEKSIFDRMKAAALLDIPTYEEVEANESLTGQAAMVVVIGSLASAIGGLSGGVIAALVGALLTLCAWVVYAGVAYFIGTSLFKGTATWGEMLRTTGYAQAPNALLILAIVPILGYLVRLVVMVWVLVCVVIGIRQALDVDTGQAVATGCLAALVVFGVMALITMTLAAMGIATAAVFGS